MRENKNPVGKDGVFDVLVFGFGIPYPNGAFAHKHIISVANTEYVSIAQFSIAQFSMKR
jgi:hypothetical protein